MFEDTKKKKVIGIFLTSIKRDTEITFVLRSLRGFLYFCSSFEQEMVMHIYHSPEEFTCSDPYITVGVFDGMHLGHQYLINVLINKAKENGWTPVILTFWPHPRLVLNGDRERLRYLTTLNEKLHLMESHGIEHVLVLPFDEELRDLTACTFVNEVLIYRLHARGLLMGFNHKFGKNREGDYGRIKSCTEDSGLLVEQIDAVSKGKDQVSSTLIRDLLWSGDVSHAADLLGYLFFVSGIIVSGNKVGRNLGYPTANVQPLDEHKLLPQDGVYIAKATLSGNTFFGMVNIGVRPTMNESRTRKTIEIHLFNFHGDIYGQDVRLYFLKRTRDEIKFENIEKLREQLKKDHAFSLQWLKDQKMY
jgi:riboflavin kinase / FMN adenylyltransferase